MVQKIFRDAKTGRTFDHEKGLKSFGRDRYQRLGTKKNPAAVSVQTEKRKQELEAEIKENSWVVSIAVDPDSSEDVSDLEILRNPVTTQVNEHNVGRNDPCYCGSGKKFKRCCAK